MDRAVRLEHFEHDAHLDPRVRAVMAHVQARPHPQMQSDTAQWGAEVVVTTTDGQHFASRIDDYERRAPDARPMTRDELRVKFSDCARRALPQAQIAPAFDRLMQIDSLANIAALTALLERHPGAAQAA